MEFSNGEYLIVLDKNVNVPPRVQSKKGWLLLNNMTENTTKFDFDKINTDVNIKFNTLTYNCKYISK